MLKSLLALLVLFAAPASLQACWDYVPLEHTVDRADYVVHVKVVAIEEDNGNTYAVCAVKEILLGLIVTNRDGYVAVTSKTLKVGNELTLLAPSGEIVEGRGLVFPGDAHAGTRLEGAPTRKLRKAVQARMDDAYALLERLESHLPGAREEAEKAVIEHENGERQDYTDVSANADLLLDLVATNRGAPAEARAERPKLDSKDHERLGLIALRVICNIPEAAAKVAVSLIGGGHGAAGMLAPADITLESALAKLSKLDELGELGALQPHLIANDVEDRAHTWAAHFVLKGGHSGELGEWIWVERLANEKESTATLAKAIAPPQGDTYPDSDIHQRLMARLIDAEAWVLCAMLQQVGVTTPTKAAHAKALDSIDNKPGYLAVYAFVFAVGDAEPDNLKTMKRRISKQREYAGEDAIELDDLSALEWHIERTYRRVPAALERAFKNRE